MAQDDHRSRHDRERQEEARRALDRVERESETVLGSLLQRSADFFSAKDESTDPAEIWGKRVGRALAVIGAIGCLIYLYITYIQ
ncbi:hypothetical protein BN1110_01179 [bacterium YEK0313]|nr:hypothetical protein BN1110_01179 [bacterium YEK0313]